MLENTNTKQFYPGPILNKTLEITKFLFRNPEQVKLQKTALDEDGNAYNVDLVYGTDYEVQKVLPNDINIEDANLTASTGQITLKNTVEVLEGEKLTAYRESALIQDVDYPRTGKFPAASHEGALDYLTMQNQEQQDQIDRSLKVPVSIQNFNAQMPIPLPAKALKINANGDGFEMSEYDPDTALETTKEYMQGAQNAASAASASQSVAANSANIATTQAGIATNKAEQATEQATIVNNIYTEAVPSLNNIISSGQQSLTNTINAGQQSIANVSDALRQNQVANCLLRIPQRFIYSLQDGTLEFKAGSTVIINKEHFTLTQDAIVNIGINAVDKKFLIYEKQRNMLLSTLKIIAGETLPETATLNDFFYNTSTHTMYRYMNNAWSSAAEYSLPIMRFIGNGELNGVAKIFELFNGFGYIQNLIWVDKDVTGLVPNGRNSDGSLNNIVYTTNAIQIAAIAQTAHRPFVLISSGTRTYPAYAEVESLDEMLNDYTLYYVRKENKLIYNRTAEEKSQLFGIFCGFCNALTDTTNQITNLQPILPLQCVDSNIYVQNQDKLLENITPSRFLQFNAKRQVKLLANTFLRLELDSDKTTRRFLNFTDKVINVEDLLDTGTTLQAGKAYSIFLVPAATGGVELKVSLNSTAPAGYSPLDTRRIGGFATECRDVGNVTWYTNHLLSGWLAGDILPQSVWTIYHRPYASPNNCIYIPCGIPFWRTIYDHAGTLATTSFEYGGTVTRSRSFYGHMQDIMHAGYIMPTYEQAAISGVGCEPLKAVLGKAEASVTTAGGHLNESNHRITSIYGAEDCVGCTWKLTTIGAIGGSNWATDPSVGVHQYGSVNVLRVGGDWGNSGHAGPFATIGSVSALTAHSITASFGVSYPLPRKNEGNV